MSQIKKYAAVGGAVCLVACWPLVVGQLTQNAFERQMDQFSSQWIKGKTLTYDRGYLSTHVEVELEVVDPEMKSNLEADGFPVSVVWSSDIHHGLFSVDAETKLRDFPDFPLVIKSNVGLTGNTAFSTELGKLEYKGEYDAGQSWSFTSQPATLTGHASKAGDLDYQYQMPSFMVEFATKEKLSVDHLSGSGEGKRDDYFWIGKQSLNAEKLTFSDGLSDGPAVIQEIKLESGISLNDTGERLNMTQLISSAAVTTPEGNLTGFDMDFSILDLDKSSLTKMLTAAEKYSETGQLDQLAVIGSLEALVKQGFSLALNHLNIGFENGQLTTSVKLKLPEGIESVTSNPQQLTEKLQGEVHASAPVKLIDSDPELRKGIDELIVTEMVKQNGDNYELNATIKEGNLIFESGEKMPLASSLMMLMYLSR